MCGELLGNVPIVEEDMRDWLVDNFSQLPLNPTQIQSQQYCRAYIIGGELLPDKSNSRVHLMKLCQATKPNAKAMGECLMILQSWAWYRLPFLAPRFDDLPTYPFAKR
ncbi:hypothetical protein Lal_00049541 [Lupinus albus]|nr:hypothetical protein Lal_00049541 [Lupinus albus]